MKKNGELSYNWTLKEAVFTKDKGKVFSCFAAGGGSSLGYKLAGYDVIGDLEIDPKVNTCYVANLSPQFNFVEDIRAFKERKDLPIELYNLDILDGSPPCSTFSMAGQREKSWGKEKKFREGQKKQVLDTLFFDFIDLAKKLQPKVVVAENVRGLLLGKAIKYVVRIMQEFDEANYKVYFKELNAEKMGVPQRRKRVFFIAIRKDLLMNIPYKGDLFGKHPFLELSFNEKPILFEEIYTNTNDVISQLNENTKQKKLWDNRIPADKSFSDINNRLYKKKSYFNQKIVHKTEVVPTLTTSRNPILYDEYRGLNKTELLKASSFPQDYDFLEKKELVHYIVGMSVPPLMIAKISTCIYEQWLSKL